MGISPSNVFCADVSDGREPLMTEHLNALLSHVIEDDTDFQNHLIAIKMHFGERGNTAFVKPAHVSDVIDYFRKRGGKPFLTDTNTLYIGSRGESVSHLQTALEHGFDTGTVGAPVIISGGLRGTEGKPVPIYGKHFEEVEIATEILESDIIVGVTHFKGHEISGFGGTLKNFGMGAASRKGKLAMHSSVSPRVKENLCNGCRLCFRWCAHGAILFQQGKASIDPGRCVGCGACLPTCPEKAIRIIWNEETSDMQEKMVEYAWGALKGHLDGRAFFLNFVTQVRPLCDCMPDGDGPIVPDAGVLASRDPVALDQASVDLVNRQEGIEGSSLPEEARLPGADKFRAVHPQVDWEVQLRYAEKIGLGTRRYKFIAV